MWAGVRARQAEARSRSGRALIGRFTREYGRRNSPRRYKVGGQHPGNPWSGPKRVQSPCQGYAPPQYRTKRWPTEALMEGWFPCEPGEQIHLRIAEAAERHPELDVRQLENVVQGVVDEVGLEHRVAILR